MGEWDRVLRGYEDNVFHWKSHPTTNQRRKQKTLSPSCAMSLFVSVRASWCGSSWFCCCCLPVRLFCVSLFFSGLFLSILFLYNMSRHDYSERSPAVGPLLSCFLRSSLRHPLVCLNVQPPSPYISEPSRLLGATTSPRLAGLKERYTPSASSSLFSILLVLPTISIFILFSDSSAFLFHCAVFLRFMYVHLVRASLCELTPM